MLYTNEMLKNQQLELDETALNELVKGINAIENKSEGVCGFVLSVESNEIIDGVIRGITKLADRTGKGKTGEWTLHTIRVDFETLEGVRYNVYLSEFDGANRLGSALARIFRTSLNNPEVFSKISGTMVNLCLETLIDRMNYIIKTIEGLKNPIYLAATVIGDVSEKEIITAKGTVVKKYTNPKVYTFGYRKAEKAEEVEEA